MNRVAPWIVVALVVAGAGACLEAATPDGPILCASDAECPTNQICLETRHECAAQGTKARPPAITDVHFAPAVANGGSIELVVTADEPLDPETAPVVELADGTPTLDLAFAGTEDNVQRFLVDGDNAAEGVYPVARVTVTDVDGETGARTLENVALVLDRTPPTLFNVIVDPPAAGDAFADVAGLDTIGLHAIASEPLASASATVAGVASACDVVTTTITCAIAVVAAMPDGLTDVTLSALDLAGNDVANVAAQVVLDTRTPAVVEDSGAVVIRTGSLEVPAVTAESTLTLTFVVDEDLAATSDPRAFVDILGAPVDLTLVRREGRRLTFSLVATGVAQGTHPIRAELVDRVLHPAAIVDVPIVGYPDGLPFQEISVCPVPPGAASCLDLDGDGSFGRTNCPDGDDDDDGTPAVARNTFEIPGDGVDNDQIGGDPAMDESVGLFVDSEQGDDANDGSRGTPRKTLVDDDALPRTFFLAARATPYTIAQPLLAGVVVVGGFVRTGVAGDVWVASDARSVMDIAVVSNLDPTVLSHIEIDTVTVVTDQKIVVVDCSVGLLSGAGEMLATDSQLGLVKANGNSARFHLFRDDVQSFESASGHSFVEHTIIRSGALLTVDAELELTNSAVFGASGPAVTIERGNLRVYHSTLIGVGSAIDAESSSASSMIVVGALLDASPNAAIRTLPGRPLTLHGSRSVGALLVDDGVAVSLADVNTCTFGGCASAGGNNEIVDAGFATLFHLAAGSEALDSTLVATDFGAPSSVAADFDFDCRYADSGADVGADELP